ncbi:MAG: hypothetical protein ABI859_03120 [Pseudomonadota bacterium]
MKVVIGVRAAVVLSLLPLPALAFDWGVETSVGVLTSDNLLRTNSVAPIDSVIATGLVQFQLRETSSRLDLDVLGGLVYRDYDVQGIPSDKLPALNALLQVKLVPERLSWVFSDYLGQRAVNPNDGLLPSDREDVNVFYTGPEFRIPLAGSLWLSAAGRYGTVNYENSPFDNTRTAARIGLERELDSGRVLSLNVADARTDFRDSDRDFDILSAYLGYVARGPRGLLNLNLGATSLDKSGDGNAASKTGFFGDLRLERELGQRNLVSVDFVHRLGDSSDVFRRRLNLDPEIDTVVDVVASDLAIRESSVDVTYGWSGRRTRVTVGASYMKEEYFDENVSASRSGTGAYFIGEFQFRPNLGLHARIEWRSDTPELEETSRLMQERLSAMWNVTRTLDVEGGAENYTRRGAALTNYDETRFFLRVDWRPRQVSIPGLRPGFDTPTLRRLDRER